MRPVLAGDMAPTPDVILPTPDTMRLGRPGILALFSLTLWPPASAVAQTSPPAEVVSLHGPWRFRAGDDPAWSRPDLDADAGAGWEDITVPTGWGPIGYRGSPAAFAWYRKTVQVASADRAGLGLAMGPVD